MSRPILTTVALLGIAVFGYFGILDLMMKNGWQAAIEEIVATPGAPLPDYPDTPGRTSFTDIDSVDQAFTTIVRFFHPATTGKHPALSLFSILFCGQVVAGHAIILLEGLRTGNKWTIIWPATLWAQIYQIVPFGILIPIYAIVHIWRSPISRLSSVAGSAGKVDLLAMDPLQLAALPGAIIMGFVVPTALIGWPGLLSFDNQQIVLALWQVFPFWIGLWLYDIVVFLSAFYAIPDSVLASSATKLNFARWTYRALLLLTGAIHLATLGLTFSPEYLNNYFPSLDTSSITPSSVLVPMSILEPRQIKNFAEGTHTLLQYDLYAGSAALLVWALYQTYDSFGNSTAAVAKTVINSIWRTALVGPAGAALWALSDRDARLLADASAAAQDTKRRNDGKQIMWHRIRSIEASKSNTVY